VKLLLSPHNDDEALFAAFTVAAEMAHVVVCFRSPRHYGDPGTREAESRQAVALLGGTFEQREDVGEDRCDPAARAVELLAWARAYDAKHRPERVWAPDALASHPEHVAVALVARQVFRGRLTTYCTYVLGTSDEPRRVTSARPVAPDPRHVSAKLRALSCYESQIRHPRAGQFFTWSLDEWLGEDL